jgi:hypothetical protein
MSLGELGEPREVPEGVQRGQGARLLVALIAAGLGIGLLIAGGTWFVGGAAQTEAGFCRLTLAPCTSLSLGSVELLAGVDLPDGTVVLDAFSQETGEATEFRATVVLPDDAPSSPPPLSTGYAPWDGSLAEFIPAVDDSGLAGVEYWRRDFGYGSSTAAQGTDADGSTVILFDSHVRP